MAKIKIPTGPAMYESLTGYEIENAFEGLTNVAEILETYCNIKFTRINKEDIELCVRNYNESATEAIYCQMNMGAYAAIFDSITATFAGNEDAQNIMLLMVPLCMLDFSQFTTPLCSNTATGGYQPKVKFVPILTQSFYQLGDTGFDNGFYGNDSEGVALSRGVANTLEAKVPANYNNKTIKYSLYDGDSVQIQALQTSNITGTDAGGGFTATANPAAGAYSEGFIKIESLKYKVKADSIAFRTDIDFCFMPGFNSLIGVGFQA